MKKIIGLLLVLTLCLCGCGNEESVSLPTESLGPDAAQVPDSTSAAEETDPEGVGANTNEYYDNGNPRKEYAENPATGAYDIVEYYKDGNVKKVITGNRNTGEYSEYEYYENGNFKKSVSDNPATGQYAEWEYYENGDPKKGSYGNHTTGVHDIQEYYENGQLKYQKQQYPNQIYEGKFDEEGYCTYEYSQMPMPGAKKGLLRTEEFIADENGKLIKIILNGEVYEDPAYLAQQNRIRTKKFRE